MCSEAYIATSFERVKVRLILIWRASMFIGFTVVATAQNYGGCSNWKDFEARYGS